MNISELLDTLNSLPTTKSKIYRRHGIKMNELRELENKFGLKLPNDLVAFYTSSNGLEGYDYIFNIIPLKEGGKDSDDLGDYLVFAEYMIYSETCGLEVDKNDPNKYRIFNTSIYPIENGIIKRKYVADSLEEFIKLYCTKGTFGIWGDDESVDDEARSMEKLIESEKFVTIPKQKPWWRFW